MSWRPKILYRLAGGPESLYRRTGGQWVYIDKLGGQGVCIDELEARESEETNWKSWVSVYTSWEARECI